MDMDRHIEIAKRGDKLSAYILIQMPSKIIEMRHLRIPLRHRKGYTFSGITTTSSNLLWNLCFPLHLKGRLATVGNRLWKLYFQDGPIHFELCRHTIYFQRRYLLIAYLFRSKRRNAALIDRLFLSSYIFGHTGIRIGNGYQTVIHHTPRLKSIEIQMKINFR